MTHPLIQSTQPIVLPPTYFGSVDYYATLASHAEVVVDCCMPHDKRKKYVHRCEIVDTRHRIFLTVPVSKPAQGSVVEAKARWCDFVVSAHDVWWGLHRTALESAYGRTPFFEFYAPDILPLLCEQTVGKPVTWLAEETTKVVCRLLGLENDVKFLTPENPITLPAKMSLPPYPCNAVEYYQVRADKLGFQPGLSILDLLFNCGPEAQFVLRDAVRP